MVDLKRYIRDIPDFPKEGIVFKDITPLLKDPIALRTAVDQISDRYKDVNVDIVVSIESRGFTLGSCVAYKLGAGLVLVRKKGKLPYKTYSVSYELEYGTDTLEVHQDAIQPGQKVIIVDDLLATGGTISAVIELVERMQGDILGIEFLIELKFLNGRSRIKGYNVSSLIEY